MIFIDILFALPQQKYKYIQWWYVPLILTTNEQVEWDFSVKNSSPATNWVPY
jgi:hypothetical protein